MTNLQTCDNCGRQIGKLEQAEFWKQHIVCPECKLHLARGSSSASAHSARVVDAPPAVAAPPDVAPAPAVVNEDEIAWTVEETPAPAAWSPSSSRAAAGAGWPKWAKMTIAGTIAGVVVIVGGLHLLDQSTKNATADAAVPAATSGPTAKPAIVTPQAESAPVVVVDDDAQADHKAMDDLLAASELEASGKRAEALAAYQSVAAALSANESPTESQAKLLARARNAVARLTPPATPAKQPAPPAKPATAAKTVATPPAKPVSIFTPGADGFDDAKPTTPSPTESGKTSRDDDLPTGVDTDLPVPSSGPSDVAAADPAPEDSSEPVKKKTGIEGQLEAGQKALIDGDYKAAMTAFRNALDFDRKSVRAMHGIGVTHYQMGEQRKAVEQLEKTLTVGVDRALVHNLAVVHFKDNPMRAAKFIRDYLVRPNTPLDEPLQNVLGAALNAAGATDAKTGTVFVGLREFYFQYDRQLASARTDGMKRWGMNWIPGPQADAKWQLSQSRTQEADKLDKEVGRAAVRTKKAEEKLNDLNRSFGLVPEHKYRDARAGIKQALTEEADTRKRYAAAKQALGTTEMPQFPRYVQIIPIDALTPDKHPKHN